jgi:hypothetical protein
MKTSTIRKGLYERVDEMIDRAIATAIVVGSHTGGRSGP